MNTIKELFKVCESTNWEQAICAFYDLGYLVERHLMKRYGDESYLISFRDKKHYYVSITDDEVNEIAHFFFYSILNYPDRSIPVAWGLCKCVDLNMAIAIYKCIDLYIAENDDTVVHLLDALSISHSDVNLINEELINTLIKVKEIGLPQSKEAALRELQIYMEQIDIFPENVQRVLRRVVL